MIAIPELPILATHESYCLHGAMTFDPQKGMWKRQAICVERGRIVNSPPTATIDVDLAGMWVTPGLIDAHAHVCGESRVEHAMRFAYDEPLQQSRERSFRNLAESARYGVTALRDMGSYQGRALGVGFDLAPSSVPLPRVHACGEYLTCNLDGGHDWSKPVSGSALQDAIMARHRAGVGFIKILNDPVCFGLDKLRPAVELAHSLGLSVACHAYSRNSSWIAIEAQVDSIEHCSGFEPQMADALRRSGIAIVPTAVSALDVVSDPSEAFSAEMGVTDLTIFTGWWDDLARFMPSSIRAGLRVGVGTDAGFPPTLFGASVWREMDLLHAWGMTPEQCLAAATAGNAAILVDQALGNLNPGSYADMVVFMENPCAHSGSVRGVPWAPIAAVFIGGRLAFHAHPPETSS